MVLPLTSLQSSFGKSIFEDIKGDTSGDYRELLISLVEPRPVFLASVIHNAVKGAGTNEGAIIDALVHAPNALIKATGRAYKEKFNKDISADVGGDTSGDFKHLLVGMLVGGRDESGVFNPDLAVKDAEHLYKKGEGKIGTDENAFVEFFLTRSYLHIFEVSKIYRERHGHDLIAAIDSEFSGNIRTALKALATPPAEYWAQRLYRALQGLGTNDAILIRAFVINDRAQLRAIEAAYRALIERKKSGVRKDHGKKKDEKKHKEPKKSVSGSLASDIKGDTSGWYEKTLLSLLQ